MALLRLTLSRFEKYTPRRVSVAKSPDRELDRKLDGKLAGREERSHA
jgi:hypothetical protein